MIFLDPLYLLLSIPLAFLMLLFFARQCAALKALKKVVSLRFLGTVTVLSNMKRLVIYCVVLCAAGLFCITAASGPELVTAEIHGGGKNILLILDASLSMVAEDTKLPAEIKTADNRLAFETAVSRYILTMLHSYKFGLISFSGKGVIHSPFTDDSYALQDYLNAFAVHNYKNMGSDFSEALKSALFLLRDKDESCQIILFSDGEEVNGNEYSDELSALKKRGTPVHALVLGGSEEMKYDLYKPEDVVFSKEEKEIAKTVTIGRDVNRMKEIADKTGGMCIVLNDVESLKNFVSSIQEKEPVNKPPHIRDLSWVFLLLFACVFFGDMILSYLLKRSSKKRSRGTI